jgi:hypothetical protein
MSLDKLHQLIGSLAKNIDDNYKIATPILSVKLSKYAEAYPYDNTIGAMLRVIEKMADNNKLFIDRENFRKLYEKLYTNNTKFAELFHEELGEVESLAKPILYKRDYDNSSISTYEGADPILANALDSVFDKNVALKMYSKNLAEQAKYSVNTTLDTWNLKPTSLEVNDGNDKFLVLKANYETPKGITSFYIPVEITNNKVEEASVFISNSGVQDLNNLNIKKYVMSNAGSKLGITGSNILSVLIKAASEKREISNAELALIKLNASKKCKSDFFQNQIIGQQINEQPIEEIKIPKSDEFVSFEKQFTSNAGLAAFKFGNDKIKIARDNILRELISLGHSNPQIAISDHNHNTIFYSVSLDTGKVAFTVPVKINNGNINKPTIILCNGSVLDFNKDTINKLYVNNELDCKAAAVASPLFGLNASDLINNIREAVVEKNYVKAEDALNVLSNLGNEKAYAAGFQLFLNGISSKNVEAECKCEMIVQSSASKYPICGHTGLPLHKVYKDKEGNCRPLYRRGIDENYEPVTFMNAKIFG